MRPPEGAAAWHYYRMQVNKTVRYAVLLILLVGILAFFEWSGVIVAGESHVASVATPLDSEHLSEQEVAMVRVNAETLTETLVQSASQPQMQPASVESQLSVAASRKSEMLTLADEDPAAFLSNTIPPNVRANLTTEAQNHVEQKVSLTGTIHVIHVDDFSGGHDSKFIYSLRAGGATLDVHFAGTAPAMRSGATVRVNGYQLESKLVAGGGPADTEFISPPPPLESVGVQKVLAILVNRPNQAPTPTKEEMRQKLFASGFTSYFTEQSDGKVSFKGDVTDWILLPTPRTVCGAYLLDAPEIQQHLQAKGISLSNFGHIVFIENGYSSGCASVGKWDIPFNGTTYRLSVSWVGYPNAHYGREGSKMTGFDYILAHEMGHQLGVMHANSWSCQGQTLDSDCVHVEYGNQYDVMGSGFYGGHFNAYYKDVLGWLSESSKVRITTNKTYTLQPLSSNSGLRAAIITNPYVTAVNPKAQPLYVENRQQLGFDRLLPADAIGLHLNYVVPAFFPTTRLIHANTSLPCSSDERYLSWCPPSAPSSVALTSGGTFSWPSRGISITAQSPSNVTSGRIIGDPIATTSQRFSTRITRPACSSVVPSVTENYVDLSILPGAASIVGGTLRNNNTVMCTPSQMQISAVFKDAKWNSYVYPTDTFTLAPEEEQYLSFQFLSPPETPTGEYQVSVTVRDLTYNRSWIKQYTINVTADPRKR